MADLPLTRSVVAENGMKRRIVHMTGPLPPAVGGMASVLGALEASSLPKRVDLRLFNTGKTTPEGRSLWQGIGTRLHLMKMWWNALGPQSQAIVHIHTCSGFTFALDGILLVLARLRGARTVLHIHGARFDSFLDGLSPSFRAMARWLSGEADIVIVLSMAWQERLSKRLPSARFRVVANGISALPRRSPHSASATGNFLFLGNLCRRKGVHVILEAASLSRHPWQIDLAGGEEDPGFTTWTRDEIARRGLTSRVTLLGPIVGEAKAELLNKAIGLVLPSLAEGLPMAMLEGMAAHLPVVVTSVGAMPEVVRNGKDGYVIPPEDAPALAATLDKLAESPELRQRLGDAAAETFARAYGIEVMVEALEDIYETLPPRRK